MSNRGQSSRRRVKRLCVVLFLGCCTSIAVAWTLAITQTFRGGTYAHGTIPLSKDSSFSRLEVTQWRDSGAEYRTWHAQWYTLQCPGEEEGIGNALVNDISMDRLIVFWGIERIPLKAAKSLDGWGRLGMNVRRGHCGVTMADVCACSNWNDRFELLRGSEDARGWPLLSLWCEVPNDWTNQPSPRLDDGCIVLPGPTDITRPARALPLRPIWPGLLLNTLFYATLWSILLFVPLAIRRHYRIKHHRCPTCNYDLRNLPTTTCPECGTQS